MGSMTVYGRNSVEELRIKPRRPPSEGKRWNIRGTRNAQGHPRIPHPNFRVSRVPGGGEATFKDFIQDRLALRGPSSVSPGTAEVTSRAHGEGPPASSSWRQARCFPPGSE